MAINYTPIGFNTKTYSNPTTMNHMDNGIKSACDGVDSLSAGKVDKVSGKQLSTEDYTTAEKTKLAGIATGATKTTIKNDLTTTTAGSALDASQGKILADRIADVTADTSVHQASGTSLSIVTGKGGMRWQDEAVVGQTHKSSNVWDEQWELGSYNTTNGQKADGTTIRCKNFISCKPNTSYYMCSGISGSNNIATFFYDENKTFIKLIGSNNITFTTPANAHYMTFFCANLYGSEYKHDIGIFEGTSGSYEPYGMRSAGDGYGYVRLADLTWNYQSSYHLFYTDDLKGKINPPANGNAMPDVITELSVVTENSIVASVASTLAVDTNGRIYGTYPGHTSASDFTNAYGNKTLTYALVTNATPDTYALVVEEVGKNFVNPSALKLGRYINASGVEGPTSNDVACTDFIKVDPNTKYTYSGMGSVLSYMGMAILGYDSALNKVQSVSATTGADCVINTASNVAYVRLNLVSANANTAQFEKGNKTPYTPYQGKTYPIPLPHPARGIGDVKEKVHKVGSQWVEDTKYGVLDLGTVTYSYNSTQKYFTVSSSIPRKYGDEVNAMCAPYNAVGDRSAAEMANEPDMTMSLNNNSFAIKFKNLSYTDPAALKTAMSGVMLIYELATPTTEPLSDQSAMYEMESYVEQTHIDTADGLAEMNVEYGTSDLMATALDGQRIAMRGIV